jgi:hypothetical protein
MFTIVVRGPDIKAAPLLETKKAVAVEVHNESGELVAILHKMFDSNVWGISNCQDSDWENVKAQLGYLGKTAELNAERRKDFFEV